MALLTDAGQQSHAPEAVKVRNKSTDRHQDKQADSNIHRQTQVQTGKWASGHLDRQASLGQAHIDMVWYGMVWYGMVWYGMVWYGMVWYGMVWYGMVWYGMVWYSIDQHGIGGTASVLLFATK